MPRKRHKGEEIATKLRQVEVLAAQDKPVAEAIRSIGVTEITYYRWRTEYGGLKGDQVKRLKDLEAENSRFRRAVSDLTVAHLREGFGMSERRACEAIGCCRMTMRYKTTRADDAGLRQRMKAIPHERRRFGYRLLHVLLKREVM